MENKLFSFKHITSHPAIVSPNILRVIKHGTDETFETHYVHIDDFNRLNKDQPEDGLAFQEWFAQKPGGHPVFLVNGRRVKELVISENSFKAIVSDNAKSFKEIDLNSAFSIDVTTAASLRNSLRIAVEKKQELLLEAQVGQMIAAL